MPGPRSRRRADGRTACRPRRQPRSRRQPVVLVGQGRVARLVVGGDRSRRGDLLGCLGVGLRGGDLLRSASGSDCGAATRWVASGSSPGAKACWVASGSGSGSGLGVHPGSRERCGECGVADVVGQCGRDLVRRLDRHRVLRGLLVQHPLADGVQRARDARAYLSRTQRPTRLTRRLGYGGPGDAGPASGECGVQDPGEVDHVGLAVVELAVQRVLGPGDLESGVHDVPDQLDGAGVRDQHGLGVEPSVGDALGVPGGDRLGHLAGQPGGARGRKRAALEHQVQRDAVAPLVHDPGDAVPVVAVQHPQQVRVGDGRRDSCRLEQVWCPRVVAGYGVDRHAARQDRVRGAPEPCAGALGEQVVEAVAVGEDGPGSDRSGRHVTHLPGPFQLSGPVSGPVVGPVVLHGAVVDGAAEQVPASALSPSHRRAVRVRAPTAGGVTACL